MNFKILSFNVRGLNCPSSIRLLRTYISNTPQLDLICLQEHKLCLAETDNLRRYLWPGASSWIQEASPGYNNTGTDPGAGCGGISLLLAQKWYKLVTETGHIMNNRAQFVILKGLPGGNVGFINVYAPNDTHQRTRL